MPDRLLFMLSKVQSRLSFYLKCELKKTGITLSPGQIGILLVLESNGQTTMGELSQTLEIDNAAISRLVDKLEVRQLVKRHINPVDRRQMLIHITNEGLTQANVIKKIAKVVNNKIKEGFSAGELEIYQRINQSILNKFH